MRTIAAGSLTAHRRCRRRRVPSFHIDFRPRLLQQAAPSLLRSLGRSGDRLFHLTCRLPLNVGIDASGCRWGAAACPSVRREGPRRRRVRRCATAVRTRVKVKLQTRLPSQQRPASPAIGRSTDRSRGIGVRRRGAAQGGDRSIDPVLTPVTPDAVSLAVGSLP